MNAIELFLLQHAYVQSVVDRTLLSLTDEQLNARPYQGANSIAWVVWHMTRVEDVMLQLVVGEPQLLADSAWAARLGFEARDIGTGMVEGDLESFCAQINLDGLREYYRCVGARTQEYVRCLRAEELDEVPDAPGVQTTLQEMGALGPNAEWVGEEFLAGKPKAFILSHLGFGHKQAHRGEATTILALMGVRGR